jgi:uncharacterized protein YecT (DUF1311 family)
MAADFLVASGRTSCFCAAAAPLLVGTITAAPMTAEAKGRASSDPYESCLRTGQAAEGVMPAIEDCSRAEIHRKDQELNRLYSELIHRLPAPQARALRESQRAWVQHRDKTCLKENSGGAQDENVAFLQCLAYETVDRTDWLRRRYKGVLR